MKKISSWTFGGGEGARKAWSSAHRGRPARPTRPPTPAGCLRLTAFYYMPRLLAAYFWPPFTGRPVLTAHCSPPLLPAYYGPPTTDRLVLAAYYWQQAAYC